MMDRYDQLDDESKKQFLRRYRRLRTERRTRENSILLSSGRLPASLTKWPPKVRYMLADRMKLCGLLPGTKAYTKKEQEEKLAIAEWLTGWFWRNHTKEQDAN